ncbi:MAG: polysaccharide biosynthesis C-terminal domain-containing protein [Flavobacteriaceae bacterium]
MNRTSIQSSGLTLFGFILGALNTLVLYTRLVGVEQYGTIAFILASATLISPFISLGMPQGLLRFYGTITPVQRSRLLGFAILAISLISSILFGVVYFFNEWLGQYSEAINNLPLYESITILAIALSMGVFELGFALAKLQFKPRFGVFLKEIYPRLLITLYLIHLIWYDFNWRPFILFLLISYLTRALLIWITALKISGISPSFNFKGLKWNKILSYSFLVLLGSSLSLFFLEVDKVMLFELMTASEVANYTVAVFIATTVAIPFRGYLPLYGPKTARSYHLDSNSFHVADELKSANDQILDLSTLIVLLLLAALPLIQLVLPAEFEKSLDLIPILIFAKFIDAISGLTIPLFQYSKFYSKYLVLSILMFALLVLTNVWMIPLYGLKGAAFATALTFCVFSTLKHWFAWRWFRISLVSRDYFWPVISIVLSSLAWILIEAFAIYVSIGLLAIFLIHLNQRGKLREFIKSLI